MAYCPKCGQIVPDGMAFCNRCGTPMNTGYAPGGYAAPPKERMDARLQFLIAAIIGIFCFGLISFAARMIMARLGSVTMVAYLNTVSILRSSFWVILFVEALILFLAYSNRKTTNAALIAGLVMEAVACAAFLLFPAFIFRLIIPLAEYMDYGARFLRAFGICGFISAMIFGIIGFVIKKKSLTADVIILSIAFVAALLVTVAGFIVTRFHAVNNFLFAAPLAIIYSATALVPCAGREMSQAGCHYQPNPQILTYMLCPSCGAAFNMGKKYCDRCGAELQIATGIPRTGNPAGNPADASSGGFAALGFFFPLVGLILYLVWKDTMPLKAKSSGKGALAGVITWVVLTILLYLGYFLFLASLF